ncbi:MAG TPA: phosphonate C-P lyase system protein PhnH [Candidatus Bathyarchaeia archaeon]|nr:phosphonate C-P lyase system protein PhnH [Candidatus Bathyarchaeia archaeon]
MLPGLADPVLDSQTIFRGVLEAVAHPGRVVEVAAPSAAPAGIAPASAAVCLTLLDFETPTWLDAGAATDETIGWLRFHCGCPLVPDSGRARFALITEPDLMPALDDFDAGADEYPDRSATLIVQTRGLAAGAGRRLTGPGIAGEVRLDVIGLPERFWSQLAANHARFPRGVDVILTAGRALAALPRTTRVEA